MNYTDEEKDFLEFTKNTDFKQMTINEEKEYISKFQGFSQEFKDYLIYMFPEILQLIQKTLKDFIEILADGNNICNQETYLVLKNDLNLTSESRKEFITLGGALLTNIMKCSEEPNITFEEKNKMIEQALQLYNMVSQKDTEIREHEKEINQLALEIKKENNKLVQNVLNTICLTIVGVIAIKTFGNHPFKKG